MEKNKRILNDLLVGLFNHILMLEERNLRKNGLDDLSMTEIHVVEAIKKTDFKSMSEIAKKLMVTVGTLTISVNRLVQKGYVMRKRSEEDRRVVIITLTDKGEEALGVHDRFHENMIDQVLQESTFGDDKLLFETLLRVQKFFETIKIEELDVDNKE